MKFVKALSGGFLGLIFQLLFGGTLFLIFCLIGLWLRDDIFALSIETIIFGCLYAAGCFIYWRMRQKISIKQLVWEVLMSTLPIISFLFVFDPTPKPMAMIQESYEDYRFYFMIIVTTLILFPIYSVLLNRYVFTSESDQGRKTAITIMIVFLIGIGCALLSWSIMPLIYIAS